ncbi:hypothetical protein CI088_14310 [Enterococcus plantarum]|uniref:Uncharacterized protein n=1 Tax=Enterococcus plantarum TaxID=1077675 RepID=A0A2W4B503_9ENTE|nr:hypothetical protein [Enterococcus plantarum]PZL71045.1 hypothetical protein CI088_14310 [Enterococcus plantarum]
MLIITLKNGDELTVHEFEKVSYLAGGPRKEKTAMSFNEIIIDNNVTYNFIGETTISIRGSEILYIKLINN